MNDQGGSPPPPDGDPQHPERPGGLGAAEQRAILIRLNRIEGQLRGVRRMIAEPRSCIEVLQQLASVEAGLSGASAVVFRCHVERYVACDAITPADDVRRFRREMLDILERFAKLRRPYEPSTALPPPSEDSGAGTDDDA